MISIATERLELRPLVLDDLDELHRLFTDPQVRRYLLDDQIVSREWTQAEILASANLFRSAGHGLWAVLLAGKPALIGFCGYRLFHQPPELQLLYGIAPSHWDQGFAGEAAGAMMRYGFEEVGLSRIIASADAVNRASIRVMEKVGMKFDKRVTLRGLDTIYYAIAREEFRTQDTIYIVNREEN